MIRDAIRELAAKKDLAPEVMAGVMMEILSGATDTADIVAFLTNLSEKGETVGELTAAVEVMLRYVDPIVVDRPSILDTCGTGGDRKGTFNISTVTAFVAAGAGVTVAKHGNRSVSSCCGSADVLEALGVKIDMERPRIKECLEEIGIAFLFAPKLHPAMKHVMPARKAIAGKTMFNILGPLINPARATNQLIGVYDSRWVAPLAKVLLNLGTSHVLVVHGKDGLDEVTTTDSTFVAEGNHGTVKEYTLSPEDLGLSRASMADLVTASLKENVETVQSILSGAPGKRRDIVLMNAACAVYAAGKARSIQEGMEKACQSLDSGAAMRKLELLKEFSQK